MKSENSGFAKRTHSSTPKKNYCAAIFFLQLYYRTLILHTVIN